MSIEGIIICAALIGVVLIIALIPLIKGAAQKRSAITPAEIHPPRGASPMDVLIQYYGKNAKPRALFNPLMLYWAERGFITIEEDCKRGLKLTKLKDIERPDSDDGFNPKTFSLEQNLFYYIFDKRDVFYTLGASSDFAEFYEKIMSGCKVQAERVSYTNTHKYSVLTTVLSIFLIVAVTIVVGFSINDLQANENAGIIVAMLFPIIALVFLRFAWGGATGKTSVKYMLIPFFAMWGGVPLVLVLFSFPLPASIMIGTAFAVSAFMMYAEPKLLDLRTSEQLITYGRIRGFKRFLLLAEVRQLELLVENNPEYFYEILPYCYVLGITEKLKQKFDRIIMDGPGWYLGDLRETLMF